MNKITWDSESNDLMYDLKIKVGHIGIDFMALYLEDYLMYENYPTYYLKIEVCHSDIYFMVQ